MEEEKSAEHGQTIEQCNDGEIYQARPTFLPCASRIRHDARLSMHENNLDAKFVYICGKIITYHDGLSILCYVMRQALKSVCV